jgi:CBS domain-containing protein
LILINASKRAFRSLCGHREAKMTVSTILAAKGRDVVTIEPSASIAAAAELLGKKRIGA